MVLVKLEVLFLSFICSASRPTTVPYCCLVDALLESSAASQLFLSLPQWDPPSLKGSSWGILRTSNCFLVGAVRCREVSWRGMQCSAA